jgi:mannobiose 2-epimerase
MIDKKKFQKELKDEVTDNILPFWREHAVDPVNGGFYGAVTDDLQALNDVPRSAVLCCRILWTFAAAHRILGGQEYLSTARRAYDYLTGVFWDPESGGLFFSVDVKGLPVSDRKHFYAQAFGVYGLAEYYRATKDEQSLELARRLFDLMENHAHDPARGGYLEAGGRKWERLADMRLSEKDLNCPKSMNTNLHVLEAYSNLLRARDDPLLGSRHKELVEVFLERIIDPETDHFRLFFDEDWKPLSDARSYGHDIEGSWLLWEAAEIQNDAALKEKVQTAVLRTAQAVHGEAFLKDGSLAFGGNRFGVIDTDKYWWVQAEAMVGFYNAHQLSGRGEFAGASHRAWEYIRDRMVDREHGEWHKRILRDGRPDPDHYKIGPWECPYHAARASFEMMRRLEE